MTNYQKQFWKTEIIAWVFVIFICRIAFLIYQKL